MSLHSDRYFKFVCGALAVAMVVGFAALWVGV